MKIPPITRVAHRLVRASVTPVPVVLPVNLTTDIKTGLVTEQNALRDEGSR